MVPVIAVFSLNSLRLKIDSSMALANGIGRPPSASGTFAKWNGTLIALQFILVNISAAAMRLYTFPKVLFQSWVRKFCWNRSSIVRRPFSLGTFPIAAFNFDSSSPKTFSRAMDSCRLLEVLHHRPAGPACRLGSRSYGHAGYCRRLVAFASSDLG